MSRHTQIGPAHMRLLDDWGDALRETFPTAYGAYLCGSSMKRPDYRDIDVRIIMPDDEYEALAGVVKPRRLNLMLTLWGQRVTGLPIDCQMQPITFANDTYPGPDHPRHPLGRNGTDGIEGA